MRPVSNTGDKWGYYDDDGRYCRCCERYLSWDNFHAHSACPFGKNTICKDCRKPKSKEQWKSKSQIKKNIRENEN